MANSSKSTLPVSTSLESVSGFVRYLSVVVSKTRYAVPLDRVIGVVESTKITPLPFSPPPFEGLVLAMGQVMPQISLAALLGHPVQEGGVVVLISDVGGSVGLRVDQVHAMLQVDLEQVVMSTQEERDARPMVIGTFGDGAAACEILSLDHLTTDTLTSVPAETGTVLLASDANVSGDQDDEAGLQQAEPYLMIDVSGEVYAVKVDQLVELLELSTLRSVPHAPEWIAGMLDLRGEPILGLSLFTLLGRPEGLPGKLGLMVTHPAGVVALIAEHSHGIERYAPEQIHALREPMAGVSSYLVKADDSIVAILDIDALLLPIHEELPSWIPMVHAIDKNAVPEQVVEFQQFLTLRVGREFLAVPLDRIERLQASVQMTPIPDRGIGFDGLVDVGDAVVPVIDLRRVLSSEISLPQNDPMPPCVLAKIEGGVAGIIVNQVLRIETVPDSQITVSEEVPNLPVTHVLHLHDQLMSVVSLDRLLPPTI